MNPAPITLYKKRSKIQPREVHGLFQRWRWGFVLLTQAIFYGTPWLQWNGRQLLLFDLEARRFYLPGAVFYPQDFIYLTALLIVSAFALFLFTAVAGRLWCGYSCPQTVYTSIFLWVEQRCEGTRAQRLKLDKAGWSWDQRGWNKVWRRGLKHAIWLLIAFVTGFTFVGYFTPIRVLIDFELSAWQAFWIGFYSLATWGNAGFLREQVCLYMCPYARFQSAMFDKDTLIIGYDPARGEPRGPRSGGDCIDCGLCVDVCPTGIDIRQGLQHECIGCAACVDVCDGVMDKLKRPRGLIRYDTENGLLQKLTRVQEWRRVFRPRVLVYTALMWSLIAAMAISLWLRPPLRVDVVRDRASLGRWNEQGQLENVYRLQLMNLTEAPLRLRIRADSDAPALMDLQVAGVQELTLQPVETRWQPVTLHLPSGFQPAQTGAHPVRFLVERVEGEPFQADEKSTFLVPR